MKPGTAAARCLRAIYDRGPAKIGHTRVTIRDQVLRYSSHTVLRLLGSGLLTVQHDTLTCTVSGVRIAQTVTPSCAGDFK